MGRGGQVRGPQLIGAPWICSSGQARAGYLSRCDHQAVRAHECVGRCTFRGPALRLSIGPRNGRCQFVSLHDRGGTARTDAG